MKRQNASRHLLLIVSLALGGLVVGPAAAFAASTDGTASMTIKKALTITETTAVDFGTINAPSTDSNTFELTSGGTMNLTGTGDAFHAGDQVAGDWNVNGEPGQSASVTVAIGTWSDPAITTDASYVNGSTPATSVTLDATTGDAALAIGGQVTVTSAVTTGAKSATVTVTANYE